MTPVVFRAAVRLHFNRHGAAPLVWNIATDDYEIAVKGFHTEGVRIVTVYAPKATPDDEDGKPSAWLETEGLVEVSIICGWATLRAVQS